MIPRTIHCCWFGGRKTRLAERCIASWRKFAPDWEIREWGLEEVRATFGPLPAFAEEAIRRRRWAFASDWLRFAVLYRFGGVYFDFDVELRAPIDDLVDREWCAGQVMRSGAVGYGPGAGLALARGSVLAGKMCEWYEKAPFDGKTTVGEIMESRIGRPRGFELFPPEVFSPIVDGRLFATDATRAVHWYAMSWASPQRKVAKWLCWHGMRRVVDALLALRGRWTR